MNHYCTYFDRGYLAQGLALWASLARHDAKAVLWVLALDGETAEVVRARGDERLSLVELGELLTADRELAAVQVTRPRNEFIFTLTACWVRWLLQTQPEIGVVVYLDADLFFFADPAPIRAELGERSVLVVPHRYPVWHDDAAWYGKFNVGVLAFRDDPNGRACVDWWRERCLESCALTRDGSSYGDQKYLDEWPRRFGGVVESRLAGVNAAPWNWAGLRWEVGGEGVEVGGEKLIVFHFAQFRRVSGSWFDSGQLEYGVMPLRLRSRLYGEYWAALEKAEAEVRRMSRDFAITRRGWRASLGAWHLAALRLVCGQFWLKAGPWWIAGRLGLGRFSGRAMGFYRAVRRGAKMKSRVVVVTPTLGESPWLGETVASVREFGGRQTTHVLVAPARVVETLREQYPQAVVVAEVEGGGMYAAINAGVSAMDGEWDVMTYLNDDDLLLPRFRAAVSTVAGAGRRATIAYGGVKLIDAQGRRLGAIPISFFPGQNRALYAQRLEPVYQHGMAVNRAAWERLEGFDARMRFCGDSEFLARACISGVEMVCAGGAAGAAFRLRAGQLTKNRAAMEAERALVDAKLRLLEGKEKRTLGMRWARGVFRMTNLPIYVERILRHGFVTFDELIGRAE